MIERQKLSYEDIDFLHYGSYRFILLFLATLVYFIAAVYFRTTKIIIEFAALTCFLTIASIRLFKKYKRLAHGEKCILTGQLVKKEIIYGKYRRYYYFHVDTILPTRNYSYLVDPKYFHQFREGEMIKIHFLPETLDILLIEIHVV
jgi:hypothetical protein